MPLIQKITWKIKFFFDTLVKSITNFPFYKEIAKAKFTFSLKYLFTLFYILSLATSIIFASSISVLVLPNIPKFISVVKKDANNFYPEGLVFTIKNGVVSTNEKEPFYVDTLANLNLNKGYDHFITINTKADPSEIKTDSTLILITKDSVVTADKNNAYKVYQIESGTNYKLDKNSFDKVISKLTPLLKYLEPLAVVLIILLLLIWPIVAAAVSLVGQLIYLLVFTSLFFIAVKFMKKDLKFKKLYQLTMHACSLPVLVTFAISSIGVQMPFLLGSAILVVFMFLVIGQF